LNIPAPRNPKAFGFLARKGSIAVTKNENLIYGRFNMYLFFLIKCPKINEKEFSYLFLADFFLLL
jgi:hypothetical protein